MSHLTKTAIAIVSILCVTSVQCYFIVIDAHAEECFFDKVTSGTKMSLMFEVAEGGFLDIDVKVASSSVLSLLDHKIPCIQIKFS